MDRTARTSVLLSSIIILGTTSVAYGQTTRRSFQMSVNLELGPDLNANVARLPIPAGKRFVIERRHCGRLQSCIHRRLES